MEDFFNFEKINDEIQSWPLDDYEKRMLRNGRRRKFPISREETLLMIEAQREYLAENIFQTRRALLAEGISKEQILLWENDPEGRDPWKIYAASEEGRAELRLRAQMEKESYKRALAAYLRDPENNPDVPPF